MASNGMIYDDTASLNVTNIGTPGQVMVSNGPTTAPSFQNVSATGALTSITAGTNIGVVGSTVSFSGILPIANGGSNQSSFTNNCLTYYDGTSISSLSSGSSGQLLSSNGSSSAPSYISIGSTGALTSISSGTNIAVTGSAPTQTVSFSGVLPIANGGTNQTTYTTNSALFYDGSVIKSIGTGSSGQLLISNGALSAPSFANISSIGALTSVVAGNNIAVSGSAPSQTISFSGTLPIASGGSNQTSYTTNSTIYYDGTKLNSIGTGTSGQFLKSNGSGSAPSFAAIPTQPTPAASCSCLAIKTANQNIAISSTTQITFGTEIYDSGNNFASNAFTAPTSGKIYCFNIQIYAVNASLTDRVSLMVNGSAVAISQMAIVLGILGAINISIPLMLNASDVVTLSYTNSSALTQAVINGQSTPYNSWFSVYQLT